MIRSYVFGRKRTCNGCGSLKEENYINDTHCAKCRSEINKARRIEKRECFGLPKYRSGRSPLCCSCKQPKEPGLENESRCKKCKSDSKKLLRAKKREIMGMAQFGSGRKPECCRCGGPKERIEAGYCNKCKNYTERERRKSKILEEDFVANERKKVNERYKNDPEFALKKLVWTTTNRYIKSGFLVKKPCEVCGNEKVDAHHDDYAKPLSVRWLCRKHHNEHHRNESKI
ncbi:hypothetical protein UFOVP270_35 [uncultured Caudovirales phage]|jgi:hypothetical protein|uniref:Uncharacterized protein n=1 Tax=uncultured Caudovirales phage TaxID=2100421 RepID=A0A6J5L4S6_9CAUD|nr:hypothetical protein UFOVP101_21 [uncultured Caudovirales phage]CAB4134251.1 hypothetical protein UFOVP270_35 [uncultured Caudovirales phage]